MKNLKINYLALFTLLLACAGAWAQTNPQPHALSNGRFDFGGYEDKDITEYPKSMLGWKGAFTNVAGPGMAPTDLQATGDIELVASAGDAGLNTNMLNEGPKGISIRGANNAEASLALVVSISTIGASNLSVIWKANPIHAYANVNSAIQLQYRIGESGNWTNLDSNEYVLTPEKAPAGAAQLPGEVFGPTVLPASLENQPVVQFRWIVYYVNAALIGTGNRAAVDSIIISAQNATPQSPKAEFEADKTSATVAEPILFKDQSTASPTSYFWDFGDGATSTDANPQHAYQAAGKYSVKLKVSNSVGSDSITKVDYIEVAGGSSGVSSRSGYQLQVYPNPSEGLFTIASSEPIADGSTIKIYDMTGRIVLTKNATGNNEVIDASSLNAGLYLLKVEGKSKSAIEKLSLKR